MGDQQINQIIFDLSRGIDKDTVARKYGYSQFLNLNTVMNRKGYSWDSKKQNFTKHSTIIQKSNIINTCSRGKVNQVIRALEKDKDARSIARELGFKSHREMANYMAEKGYHWDHTRKNYIQNAHYEEAPAEISKAVLPIEQPTGSANNGTIEISEEYKEILQFLVLKKDKLYEILLEGEIARSLPNYIIPGRTFTKSIQITEAFDQLLKAFSEEKNIPQKNIVQIALIEFFQKYGYKHEVEAMFQ
jgi:hypothetical protein